jgi:hypothetical protein
MMNENEARVRLEQRLRRPVRTGSWRAMVDGRWVQEVIDASPDDYSDRFEALAQEYRKQESYADEDARGSRDPGEDALPADERLQLAAQLRARDAEMRRDVRGFRRQYLQDVRLSEAEAGAFVRRQRELEGAPTVYATGVLEAGGQLLDTKAREVRFLWFDGEFIPVHAGDVLDALRAVAEELAHDLDWHPGDAARYLLCGTVPPIHRVRASVAPDNRRILLDVHPTATASEVAGVYRRLRAVSTRPSRRPKRPEALLVEFIEAHPGMGWPMRMRLWNETYPQWSYTSVPNMHRDCTRALKRASALAIC